MKNSALRIYSSNEIAALPIDPDDRRFLVLDVSHARQNDREYYKALREAVAAGELAAFVHEALAADLRTFDLDRLAPYKTEARAKLAEATASTEDDYLLELLDQGRPVGDPLGWAAQPWKQHAPDQNNPWRTGDILLPRNAVHQDYIRFVQNRYRGAKVRNVTELYGKINRVLGTTLFRSHQARASGDRDRFRFLGSLAECRAAYDKHTGFPRDWTEFGPSRGQRPAGLLRRTRWRALRRRQRRGRLGPKYNPRSIDFARAHARAAELSHPSRPKNLGRDSGNPLFF